MLTNPSHWHIQPRARLPRSASRGKHPLLCCELQSQHQALFQTTAAQAPSQEANGPGSPGGLGTFGNGVVLRKEQVSAFTPCP